MDGYFNLGLFFIAAAACVLFSTNGRANAPVIATTITTTVAEERNAPDSGSNKKKQLRFVAVNHDLFSRDVARGGGEYIGAMAYLQGCPIEVTDRYVSVLQSNFDQVFPRPEMDSEAILANLNFLIDSDQILKGKCI